MNSPLKQGIKRLEYRTEPRTRDEMPREMSQNYIKQEDLMYFPTSTPMLTKHDGRNRDAAAEQHSPLPLQGKTGQNDHRIIFDRYEDAQAQTASHGLRLR